MVGLLMGGYGNNIAITLSAIFEPMKILYLISFFMMTYSLVAQNNKNEVIKQIKISVGERAFTATMAATESASALAALLPVTLKMIELNGNEKYAQLPTDLPTNEVKPNSIQVGDLMLYGSKTLVLFYKTFSTNYSYTPLGKVDDAAGLAKAFGAANVQVTFALK
jgi:hypothetical protein